MVDETSRRPRAPHELQITLPRDAQAPGAARAAISGFFDGRKPDAGALASLRLLVSELVTNAVLHSDAPPDSEILMSIRLLDADSVRIEVLDHGSGFTPSPRNPDRHHGGYGLNLVEHQASSWGVEGGDPVCVWFEMDLAEAPD
jgi:anti-sigma regulatory factor (Ser/Thr protein kinase)